LRRQAAFVVLLLASDLGTLFLSFLVSFTIRKYAPGLPPLLHGFDLYLDASPALLLWPLMLSQQGLYPGYWLTTREELRRAVGSTTLASLLAVALTFVTRTGLTYSRPILVGGWALSLVLVPGGRFVARRLATRWKLSGPSAVVLGAGPAAAAVITLLRQQHPPALRPVAVFGDRKPEAPAEVAAIPVVGTLDQASDWATGAGVETAIVALEDGPTSHDPGVLKQPGVSFRRVIVVSDLFGASGAGVVVHDLQGAMALELRRNLLSRANQVLKRTVDVTLLMVSLILTLPLAALISLAILAESGWPVIFGQARIGREGRTFTAWKFRSMVGDAEEILRKAVGDHPGVREEWEERQKLRADPRLTRVGRLLRRTSMDELPQLWNVFVGEMSLVGPRPIVAEEVPRYGESFHLYTLVPPGLTGLWQVSGRSNTTYAERVWLDTHYVRNWSIWMDAVILVRTVWVVVAGIGAY
jgi:Undecaprenyl-phosphate galactose phosphotransferase WbaP